jgi:hypothetical protein
MSRHASIGCRKCRHEGNVLIRRLVYVAFFLEVGLLLVVLPWSAFWEQNYFAEAWPPLAAWLKNDYLRGAVSGLGVVNLFAGFADLALIFSIRERARVHDMHDVHDVHEVHDVHDMP